MQDEVLDNNNTDQQIDYLEFRKENVVSEDNFKNNHNTKIFNDTTYAYDNSKVKLFSNSNNRITQEEKNIKQANQNEKKYYTAIKICHDLQKPTIFPKINEKQNQNNNQNIQQQIGYDSINNLFQVHGTIFSDEHMKFSQQNIKNICKIKNIQSEDFFQIKDNSNVTYIKVTQNYLFQDQKIYTIMKFTEQDRENFQQYLSQQGQKQLFLSNKKSSIIQTQTNTDYNLLTQIFSTYTIYNNRFQKNIFDDLNDKINKPLQMYKQNYNFFMKQGIKTLFQTVQLAKKLFPQKNIFQQKYQPEHFKPGQLTEHLKELTHFILFSQQQQILKTSAQQFQQQNNINNNIQIGLNIDPNIQQLFTVKILYISIILKIFENLYIFSHTSGKLNIKLEKNQESDDNNIIIFEIINDVKEANLKSFQNQSKNKTFLQKKLSQQFSPGSAATLVLKQNIKQLPSVNLASPLYQKKSIQDNLNEIQNKSNFLQSSVINQNQNNNIVNNKNYISKKYSKDKKNSAENENQFNILQSQEQFQITKNKSTTKIKDIKTLIERQINQLKFIKQLTSDLGPYENLTHDYDSQNNTLKIQIKIYESVKDFWILQKNNSMYPLQQQLRQSRETSVEKIINNTSFLNESYAINSPELEFEENFNNKIQDFQREDKKQIQIGQKENNFYLQQEQQLKQSLKLSKNESNEDNSTLMEIQTDARNVIQLPYINQNLKK
ncbi:hypothetical protein PPERSA_04998 [Pseudocohnilembus persalinus]|uniref:Uncharacterized protein n=1 Tax=Pseudocohnilembus persalinus TaxID=266149 RepID=A0A0V0QW34_PSEPJ|nr:hypothetical protein PPERSA_04998 [Pseudocohnilembus persalinus]|eukprot:KRX06385.1 hypothetical protein PPERSA_04998 [Pseudocohnilembus persalinus]